MHPEGDEPGPARRLLEAVTTQPTQPERAIRLSEALALGAGTAVALVAWASLVLATLGAHSLPGVLALAGAALVAVGLLVWRLPGRPGVQVDVAGLVLAGVVALVAAGFALPGFPYGVVDKDPGVYVVHAQAIAREGTLTYDDQLVADGLPVTEYTPGARFAGIWRDGGDAEAVRPQFFHLYPALLAVADDVGGPAAGNHVNALLAALSAATLALVVRRAFGVAAGGAAGLLLATNLLQVWSAKYPTTEVLAQLLLVLALLSAALALETRWRPPALLAGLFLTLTFLARPDGVLVVLGALAAVAVIVARRGWDRRLGWFLAGLALALPHAALQAWRWSRAYSDANDTPTPRTFVAVVLLLVVGIVVWRSVARRPVEHVVHRLVARFGVRRLQVVVGAVLALATAAFLVVLWNRETLFGQHLLMYNTGEIRSYDEINLLRLSWFVTVPALVLLCAGVLVLGVRRWRAVQWLVVLPVATLLPLYLWSARISPRLMWWGRRYVPSALVAVVVLVAIALAFAWAYRGRWWPAVSVAATVAFVGLVATYAGQSATILDHRELAGTAGVVRSIAELSGDQQGVYLWAFADDEVSTPGRDLGAAVWLAHDQLSALLPRPGGEEAADVVAAYREAYPDHPIFVVTPGDDPPPGALVDDAVVVQRVQEHFPVWDEDVDRRPDEAISYPIDLSVWRLTPLSPAGATSGG